MWGKMSPREILAEHVVDIQKVVADFRDASERIQSSSSQSYGVNKYFSSQSPVQKRLSIYNWNPGSRREKEDAFEKQIAVKWHIVTLQEASDDVDHDILQENLGGCYKVVSRASFRRQPRNGPKFFTVMSLHINNNYAKKRGIGKKLLLTIRALCRKSTCTWSLVTSTELPGSYQMVTTPNPPVLSRKPSPTQIYQCRLAPHRCGAQVHYHVNGLTFVILISLRTRLKNGRSVCMELSLFTTRSSASVHKIKVAIMRCGCTWTMLTTRVYLRVTRETRAAGPPQRKAFSIPASHVSILSHTQTRFSRLRLRTRTRPSHCNTIQPKKTTGWLFASGSSWTLRHTGGSRQDTHGTRCPKGKAVGGPRQTTSDERPSGTDMPWTNVL